MCAPIWRAVFLFRFLRICEAVLRMHDASLYSKLVKFDPYAQRLAMKRRQMLGILEHMDRGQGQRHPNCPFLIPLAGFCNIRGKKDREGQRCPEVTKQAQLCAKFQRPQTRLPAAASMRATRRWPGCARRCRPVTPISAREFRDTLPNPSCARSVSGFRRGCHMDPALEHGFARGAVRDCETGPAFAGVSACVKRALRA